MFAAWVDDGAIIQVYCDHSSMFISLPVWSDKFIYKAQKSPRAAFIEQCQSLSAAEIYDAIKSGKLKVD